MDNEVTQDTVDDSQYTPEELAMFGAQDTDSAEDVVEVDDDVVADETADAEDDPWAWAKDADPAKVRNTWEKFTKEWEQVLKEKETITPYKELAEEIQSNPALAAHIRQFFEAGGDKDPNNKLLAVEDEVNNLKAQLQVKEELIGLESYVKENELPSFKEKEVIQYAADNHSPNLMSAYKEMMFDEIRQAAKEKAFEEVKKTKGAAIPKVGAGEKSKAIGSDIEALLSGSEEEFEKNYGLIAKHFGS